ncbi:poly(U)-binding-splicing factor PUF60-B [Striga asiatica]|uniref:Poly(U)-binding-splicing factor PUF60-B n=1 Tax=Striga asiatica TaxID=4170 RepID=A0A5A7R3W1_STRAF|nr:poly(U)-binding-splicing factor PUF60-B [Striga asiatica]
MENPNQDAAAAAQTLPSAQENTSLPPPPAFPSSPDSQMRQIARKVAYLPDSVKSFLITEVAANHCPILFDLCKLNYGRSRQIPPSLPSSLSPAPGCSLPDQVAELLEVVARDESRKIYVHNLSGETSMDDVNGVVGEFGAVEELGFRWSTTLATVKYFDPQAARRALETPVEVMNRHHLQWHSVKTGCSICEGRAGFSSFLI